MERLRSRWGHGTRGRASEVASLRRRAGTREPGHVPPLLYGPSSSHWVVMACGGEGTKQGFPPSSPLLALKAAVLLWHVGCINSLNLKPLPMPFWDACPHPGLKSLRNRQWLPDSQPGPRTSQGEASGPSAKPVFVPQLCASQECGSHTTREQHFIYTVKQMKTCSAAESCRPTCDRTRFSLQKEGDLVQALMWRDLGAVLMEIKDHGADSL